MRWRQYRQITWQIYGLWVWIMINGGTSFTSKRTRNACKHLWAAASSVKNQRSTTHQPNRSWLARHLWHIPPHQLEPVEAVVERVVSRQAALAVLQAAGGHLSRTVVHLPHLVQALPAGVDREQVVSGGPPRKTKTMGVEQRKERGGALYLSFSRDQ